MFMGTCDEHYRLYERISVVTWVLFVCRFVTFMQLASYVIFFPRTSLIEQITIFDACGEWPNDQKNIATFVSCDN